LKQLTSLSLLFLFLIGCRQKNQTIVSANFVDSFITHYSTPQAIKANEAEIQFWKNRISPNSPDYTNASRYASTLIGRFHLQGNLRDVQSADSVLQKISADYANKEAGPFLNLVSHYILQHRFKQADSVLQIAQTIGIKKYESNATAFDVAFELGNIGFARTALQSLKAENDYGYQFRKSKMMHYDGELDYSINAMRKAVDNAGQNEHLRFAALSNVGDLYIHAGQLDKAYNCFVECLKANTADLHSLMGIGWIALKKDQNDSLAEKIFQFVATKTASPDPLFKLIAVAEQRDDSSLQLKYAKAFESKVTDAGYGNMYNKYLIQLYSGILDEPAKAVAIAERELKNRNTAQTQAWYAWSLVCNQQEEKAYAVFQKSISGKPLEGLELYWMGKLMLSVNKGYNAKQFFKEAKTNKYDLLPSVATDLANL
jgi:hypothetical protein